MPTITLNKPPSRGSAFLQMGFRPFFAAAGLGGSLLMLFWLLAFSGRWQAAYQGTAWHAHEMIFGFGLAAIAGFLLTAVRNWTGRDTLVGRPLGVLFGLWVATHVLALFEGVPMILLALLETLFIALLVIGIARPILAVRQTPQLGIVAKVALFLPASWAFYLGLAGIWPEGVSVGLYAAFYLILALVLTLARRVMPMFIERGLNNGFMARNNASVDRWSLILFLLFALADTAARVCYGWAWLDLSVQGLAVALSLLHAYRLAGWHHPAVWRKPMVWVLVLAYAWVVFGFALKGLGEHLGMSHSLAIHAFAAGGMGLVVAGMMARVSLGHTGRNINEPPRGLVPVFYLLALVPILRVLAVWLFPAGYLGFIHAAQGLWVLAYAGFTLIYLPILWRARLDGQRG